MPLPGGSGVRRGIINNSRCHDVSHYGFMSDEGGSAINVLALTVTLFCLIRYPKATPRMRRVAALWTIHHYIYLPPCTFQSHNDTHNFHFVNLISSFLNHQSSLPVRCWS
nr:MAG TPA_asm: hypothetical protein [Caudoviricetes sp.]